MLQLFKKEETGGDQKSVLGQYKDYLTADERRMLMKKSDMKAWATVWFSWIVMLGLMYWVSVWPHPVSIIVAVFLIGGRLMGLSVIMHETSHATFFKNKKLNDFVGKWFAAYPLLLDMLAYRDYHLQHHKYTGQRYAGGKGDPDIVLVRFYPLTKAGFRKWMINDLTGKVAWRQLKYQLGLRTQIKTTDRRGRTVPGPYADRSVVYKAWLYMKLLRGPILVHSILLGGLVAVGAGWSYLLWWAAYFTTYQAILRIRIIAEHGLLPQSEDMLVNTRTTIPNIFEKLFFPHNVNYHLEHHMFMGIPGYNLAKAHKILKARGVFETAPLSYGYWPIIKQAASRTA